MPGNYQACLQAESQQTLYMQMPVLECHQHLVRSYITLQLQQPERRISSIPALSAHQACAPRSMHPTQLQFIPACDIISGFAVALNQTESVSIVLACMRVKVMLLQGQYSTGVRVQAEESLSP